MRDFIKTKFKKKKPLTTLFRSCSPGGHDVGLWITAIRCTCTFVYTSKKYDWTKYKIRLSN